MLTPNARKHSQLMKTILRANEKDILPGMWTVWVTKILNAVQNISIRKSE